MIFVATGTHYKQFNRLVRSADELCARNKEKVIIQRGCSNYIPICADHFQWTTNLDMEAITREARVVISQASAGAIIVAMKFGKPLVLVPRLKRFGESHDDHQQQLARTLATKGRVVIVENPSGEKLSYAVREAFLRLNPGTCVANQLQYSLRQKLIEWSEEMAIK